MGVVKVLVDVSEAAALGERAVVAMTVQLPDAGALPARPVVCFAKPGAGFSRRYFTDDLPGSVRGSQSEWHAARGWIFVALDYLGAGESSRHDPLRLTYAGLAAANHAAEEEILVRLRAGTVASGFPPLVEAIRLGIGQSLGGCLTVVQQGRYHDYDGIAVLGFSALHVEPPVPPGHPPIAPVWRPRDAPPGAPDLILNQGRVTVARRSAVPTGGMALEGRTEAATHWTYYWDDLAAEHLWPRGDGATSDSPPPPWGSDAIPGVRASVLTPGIIAPEAAAVDVPVLVAVGERDIVADPRGEARAYLSSTSVDLFVCPKMAHMHNFAGTCELLWQRLATWADWVACWQRIAHDG